MPTRQKETNILRLYLFVLGLSVLMSSAVLADTIDPNDGNRIYQAASTTNWNSGTSETQYFGNFGASSFLHLLFHVPVPDIGCFGIN